MASSLSSNAGLLKKCAKKNQQSQRYQVDQEIEKMTTWHFWRQWQMKAPMTLLKQQYITNTSRLNGNYS